MESFEAAVSEGISPVDFWQLTPYLTSLAADGLYKLRMKNAWVQAHMARAKKIPKIEDLTTKKKQSKPIDLEAKFKSMFGVHNLKRAKNGHH